VPFSSLPYCSFTFLGLDVHRDSISVAVVAPDGECVGVDRIFADGESVRRLVGRLGDRSRLRAVYEAGPTGYGLCRQLRGLGVSCEVVAPALIPRAAGDRVKTDRRDAVRLARLARLGELVSIRVPSEAEEGVRDLLRARAALLEDRRRARQRLSALLLRHGEVFRDGSTWTHKHQRWLGTRTFDDSAARAAFDHCRAVESSRDQDVRAIETELSKWFDHELFADRVARLGAYRGIDRLGALTLVAEVCDWRRFATAGAHSSFCGLVPSERSSGQRTWRGLTKAGNTHVRHQLIESAWAYQHHARVGAGLAARQNGVHPDTIARAWKCQLRLCRRFAALAARKDSRNVVAVAVARELGGFVWAEMTA